MPTSHQIARPPSRFPAAFPYDKLTLEIRPDGRTSPEEAFTLSVRYPVDFSRPMRYTGAMKLPFFAQLFKSLTRPPATNPFPAAHLPASVTDYLGDVKAGAAKLNPPVPFPPGGRARIAYDPASCIGCKLCIKVCPAHAIDFLAAAKKIRIFRANCIACGQCTEVCAKKCLSMDGEFLQADTDRNSPALVAE